MKTHEQLMAENEDLRRQLAEAGEALEAIRRGDVDAVVIERADGPKIYSITDADQPYRLMVEDMQEGAVMLREDGIVVYGNRQVARMLGTSSQNILGKSFRDVVTSATLPVFDALFQCDDEASSRSEIALSAADGSTVPVMAACRLFYSDGLKLVSVVITDLTELKRNEEMAASEAFVSSIIDQAADAVVVCDHSGKIIRTNQTANRLSGTNPLFKDFNTAFPLYRTLQKEETSGGSTASMAREETFLFPLPLEDTPLHGAELYLSNEAGRKRRDLLLSAAPLFDTNHGHLGSIVSMVDITRQKRVEAELRESERQLRESQRIYRAIGESIAYGVWICTPDGRNIYASESFLNLVGQTQQQCSDLGWVDMLHPDDVERTIAAWKECLREGKIWDIEHRFRGVDGHWHPILARGIPVRDELGRIICWAGINLDISRMKRTEEEIKKANRALEEANEAKNKFLATMSHDLRTPLNAVIGFSELLRMDPAMETVGIKQKEAIKHIAYAGRHLLNLVEGLLNLSAMESGKITLKREMVDLKVVLEELSSTYEFLAGQRGIKWCSDIKVIRPVFADRHRLMEVFNNLVSNAIKYTKPAGSIKLGAIENESKVTIFVEDTGDGIDKKDFERIFLPFEQGRSPGVYQMGKSVGLGLAICRHFAELHGGRLTVESTMGEGSCFTLTLPYTTEERSPETGDH